MEKYQIQPQSMPSTYNIQAMFNISSTIAQCLKCEMGIQELVYSLTSSKESLITWKTFFQATISFLSSGHSGAANPQAHIWISQTTSSIFQIFKSTLTSWPGCTSLIYSKLGLNFRDFVAACCCWLEQTPKTDALMFDHICECIMALLKFTKSNPKGDPKLLSELSKYRDTTIRLLCEGVLKDNTVIGQEKILMCIHNWITVCNSPLENETIESHFIPLAMLFVSMEEHNSSGIALALLAKLQSRNPKPFFRFCETSWDTMEIVKHLGKACHQLESGNLSKTLLNESGHWIQICTGCLTKMNDEFERSSILKRWESDGGLETLMRLVKACRDIVFKKTTTLTGSNELLEVFDRIIGNAALALSECLRNANHCKILHECGLTEPLVELLRFSSDRMNRSQQSTQKNIAIACARLSQFGPALERIRQMQAIELLSLVGAK
ncbi:hypothetical protein BC830DRAFT_404793 [Chytriomyces sp. MP71]|nr:hypothetical protein BC830DRAFT_404793 [Chytriomyces sp. MP71]